MSVQMRRTIVAVAAVVYGVVVAFNEQLGFSEDAFKIWLLVGAAIVGALWLLLMVIPWFKARQGSSVGS